MGDPTPHSGAAASFMADSQGYGAVERVGRNLDQPTARGRGVQSELGLRP